MARRGSCAPDGDQCAVLGLLTWGERSGYELSKLLDQSVAYFWSSAKAQAYAVLPRLVERRFAEAPHVAQMDRPDKTVYRITAAGKRALAAGLRQEHPYLFRDPLMLKVFFGAYLDEEEIVVAIDERRRSVQARIEALEETELEIAGNDQWFFPYLALRRGLELNKAQLRWAEETLRLLARPGRDRDQARTGVHVTPTRKESHEDRRHQPRHARRRHAGAGSA